MHRRGHRVEAELVLLDRHRVAGLAHPGQLLVEPLGRGHRPRGQRGHPGRLSAAPVRRARLEVGDQHLAAGRAVQRRQPADPVVRWPPWTGPRAWSTFTAKCSCSTATLIVSPSSAASRTHTSRPCRTTSSRSVTAPASGISPTPSRYLPRLPICSTSPRALERAEQPERGRLVHGDLRGHLADPGLPAAGQHLQHADGPVDRVHDTVPTGGVAHGGTVSLNSNSSLDVAVVVEDDQRVPSLFIERSVDNGVRRYRRSDQPVRRAAWSRRVDQAGPDDVERAVAAARTAFDSGPWRSTPAAERGALLRRVAEFLRRDKEEIARTETLDTGKTLAESRIDVDDVTAVFRFYADLADKDAGRIVRHRPGRSGLPGGARAGRGLRADHAVELPAAAAVLEGRPGAGRRQHLRDQAERGHPADLGAAGAAAGGGRGPARGGQHRARRRPLGRRPAHRARRTSTWSASPAGWPPGRPSSGPPRPP